MIDHASNKFDLGRLKQLRAADAVPPSQLLSADRVLARAHRYTVVYGPFDMPPCPTARLVLIGLTPGYTQLEKANEVLAEVKSLGIGDPDEISALWRARVPFFGSMRNNLIKMLDALGLPQLLDITSTGELFSTRADLLQTTSALRYPVFVGDRFRNFGGSRDMMTQPLFQEMVERFLAPELVEMPNALLLPLGIAAESAVTWAADRRFLQQERVLLGFPHPSGGNGHRISQFRRNFEDLRAQLQRWFAR